MKAKEIRELSDEDIDRRVRDLKEELFNLRFQNATGQLENALRIRQVKKNIARLKTVKRERELAEEISN